MKLVFFGSGNFALASFEALVAAGHVPSLVVTQPPRRRRRGGKEEPTPVHAAAKKAGIAVATPVKVNAAESISALRAVDAALFVVAEYGQILSKELLSIPPLQTINVHGSLLPRWRGATPVSAAILAGDVETGITIQRTVFELDAGPVLAARATPIGPDEDAGSLTARLARLGGELLVEVVGAYARGEAVPEEPQDEARVTFCRRLKPADAAVDWTRPAREIERAVRAFRPRPGAHAVLQRDPPLPVVLRAAQAAAGHGEPGVVAAVSKDHFEVGSGEGLLRVLELIPAARKPMDARAFLNGYRLTKGERFC